MLYLVSDPDGYFIYGACVIGTDGILHFHCFQNAQFLSALDAISFFNQDVNDDTRNGRP